ncbi:hypothetical protein K010075C41_27310 [Sellimonas intestinalis]
MCAQQSAQKPADAEEYTNDSAQQKAAQQKPTHKSIDKFCHIQCSPFF